MRYQQFLKLTGSIFLLWLPSGLTQILPIDHYSIRDGLPSNWITCIFQDSRGYLWIGGDGGMSVYDGARFKNYDTDDGPPVGHVWCIQESRKAPGTMLIGTHGGGLSKLQDGKITSLNLGSQPSANVIAKIMEDRDGVIWCGSVWGVYRVDGDSVSFFFNRKRYELGADSQRDEKRPDFDKHWEGLVSLFARNENHGARAAQYRSGALDLHGRRRRRDAVVRRGKWRDSSGARRSCRGFTANAVWRNARRACRS